MKKSYQRLRGTLDFYPPESDLIQEIVGKARNLFNTFGYQEVILPILEREEIFTKSVGKTSDIVGEKQMFRVEGKDIVLRPEGTAGMVRSFIENALYTKKDFYKFFYIGPMFRGERPQKGRLRQFHHIGCEAFGSNSPYLDVEVIKLALSILQECGIKGIKLKVNSLGCQQDKANLTNFLKKELISYRSKLCPLCQRRLTTNPLRVLDCKEESCRKVVSHLDISDRFLCKECLCHFNEVLSLLKELEIDFLYQPTLVRGLDYYTNTVFELVHKQLGSQDACGAGGRYNDLVKNLGGPSIPAIGFALGLERMLLLLKKPDLTSKVLVFVAYTSLNVYPQAYKLLNTLRKNKVSSDISYKEKSLKSQLRSAEKAGANFVIIVGDEEIKRGHLIVRDMKKSCQRTVECSRILDFFLS
ncbi:MAG: histidine--tRNA ligase [Candidatus Omnitrophota bacterium]|nr:MAG: histidine--tRNA ligase [Candidatus Omnitrophota bacterium]RKY46469.1 MAG: histidine--tRNA ligase [Candidatus Omnitrophota bacterium]